MEPLSPLEPVIFFKGRFSWHPLKFAFFVNPHLNSLAGA